ncbi:MAG: hypothetical protein ACTSXW_08465 [Candidatus Baldrarchaeia archaeon]
MKNKGFARLRDTGLKASNYFYPHKVYLRIDSFGREIGIIVHPHEEDREGRAIYFKVEDFPYLIKELKRFYRDVTGDKPFSFIHADEWRQLSTDDIINSIQIGLSVLQLREQPLTETQKELLLSLIKETATILLKA